MDKYDRKEIKLMKRMEKCIVNCFGVAKISNKPNNIYWGAFVEEVKLMGFKIDIILVKLVIKGMLERGVLLQPREFQFMLHYEKYNEEELEKSKAEG